MAIYMDYAAATPCDTRVVTAMAPFWTEQFYNPSSSYLAAKKVRQALEDARARVAHWLGARPAEVVFTAGATESINLAIHGALHDGGHVLVGATEHEAVLAAARQHDHTLVPVQKDGLVDLVALKKMITDDTVLISIGYANNEIGTVQIIKEIGQIVHEVRHLRYLHNNPRPLWLHTDASQAGCYLDLHASRLGADLITLNGGKIYGPKQSGVLFVKTGVALQPQVVGGGQEMGLRSGTENVAACVGLATALDIAQTNRKEAIAKETAFRDHLQSRLLAALPRTSVNGNLKKRLPNNLHVSWPGVDGERLLMQLDEQGLMASTGSACAANKGTASHVLQAIGCDAATVQGSLRLTIGRGTTQKDIEQAADIIITAVQAAEKAG